MKKPASPALRLWTGLSTGTFMGLCPAQAVAGKNEVRISVRGGIELC